MQIDIEQVNQNDSLEGFWWHYIRNDFAFQKSIGKSYYNAFEVSDQSVLVHKQKVGDDKFPTTRYHLVMFDNESVDTYLLDGKDIRKYLAMNFVSFVKNHHQLPFACHITKESPNREKITINYAPIPKFFELNFEVLMVNLSYSIEELRALPQVEENELGRDIIETFGISPVWNMSLEQFVESFGDKLMVSGIVSAIDTRISRFKEHETVFYLVQVQNGKYMAEGGIDTFPIVELNLRLTDKAMQKYALEVGSQVVAHGKLKIDRTMGCVLQNVKID